MHAILVIYTPQSSIKKYIMILIIWLIVSFNSLSLKRKVTLSRVYSGSTLAWGIMEHNGKISPYRQVSSQLATEIGLLYY